MTDRRILSLYWQANWRYPRLAVALLVTLVFGVGVDFAVPLLVAAALSRFVESSPPLESFLVPLAAVVALQALGMLAWRVTSRRSGRSGARSSRTGSSSSARAATAKTSRSFLADD